MKNGRFRKTVWIASGLLLTGGMLFLAFLLLRPQMFRAQKSRIISRLKQNIKQKFLREATRTPISKKTTADSASASPSAVPKPTEKPRKASARTPSPVDLLRQILPDKNAAPVNPKGKLTLYPLDDRTLAVAGNYYEFFCEVLRTQYGKRLSIAENFYRKKQLPAWSLRFWALYAVLEAQAEYHPKIRDNFENASYFRIRTDSTLPLTVEKNGSWINALGLFPLPLQDGSTLETFGADLAHFAYLRFNRPLTNGEKLELTTRNGETAQLIWNDRETLSRAIKVNQVGYLPDAGKKYAYLGMWLGTLGELPVAERIGREFHLREAHSDHIVFTGKLTLRSREQIIPGKKGDIRMLGETVLELDFSDFHTPGVYRIQIPGVGRSWDFQIGGDAIGRAFYIHMRGLFHQRSGIAKSKKYTQWNFDTPDHMGAWRGGFAPNDRHYSGKNSCFTKDATGEKVSLNHFSVIEATKTEEFLPEVSGGWWDAGDFDRRTYHFQVVDDLLSSWLLFPENFSDSQLDIPESGNGIPDIVDEAAWGVELWRKAQTTEGGVGCWLEANSHPKDPNPETDQQRYYLALPTRESTLEYSAYAAKLARVYLKCGIKDKAELYRKSAEQAWHFASRPENRAIRKFTRPKKGAFTYTEPEKLPRGIHYKAALNLYLLTGEKKYEDELSESDFRYALNQAREQLNAYFLSELLEKDLPLWLPIRPWKSFLVKQAEELLKSQEFLAYRNINWPVKSPYFMFLGWGNGLPLRRGAFFIQAWRATDEKKYRDAALLLVDWMQGTNPMGRSFTTGLGKVYPVRIHCLYGSARNYKDPVPGITPYMFSGEIQWASFSRIFALREKPRKDHAFFGLNEVLLPHALPADSQTDNVKIRDILTPILPLWRRNACLEGLAVNQNEYTIWETIAPAAAACAALLPPGWKPPRDWHKQKPQNQIEQLPGYLFLP